MGRSAALAMARLAPVAARGEDMVRVGPGVLRPLFAVRPDTPPIPVGAFLLDAAPVTRAEMQGFRWLPAGPRPPHAPATGVDDFTARAHCALRGARLPTEAEWELAVHGPDETPAELPPVQAA
jgi:formylglycine-generating enzyme required for sulfatase activity